MNRAVIVFIFTIFMAIMLPETSAAQIMNINLDSNLGNACTAGKVTPGKNLFDSKGSSPSICASYIIDPATGLPALDANGNKKTVGLFKRFFCIMETTLGLIIASTFCAVRNAWMAPFAAMMMLLMAVTGVSFVLGIIQFTVKEVSIVILKMALVTMFVTNADVALNIAYGLYIGIMKATVGMLTEGFSNIATTGATKAAPYVESGVEFAKNLQKSVGDATAGASPFALMDSDISSIFEKTFDGGKKTVDIDEQCSVLGLLGGLLLAMPFITVLVFMALVSFLGFFARAAYGYIYALVMVTFLIAAMPIFVSFALFKSTTDLFEHWLKYIGSNVIQIFIVFAIMAFASMVDFVTFLEQLNGLIKPLPDSSVSFGSSVFEINISGCSICDPNFVDAGGAAYVSSSQGLPHLSSSAICKSGAPLEWGEIIEHKIFLKFMLINGAALLILTSVMDQFMKLGPDLARMLGGARLVQTIGGSSKGGGSITSALHRGTENFEAGAEYSSKKGGSLTDIVKDGSRTMRRGEIIPRTEVDKAALKQYDKSMDKLEDALDDAREMQANLDEYSDSQRTKITERVKNLTRETNELGEKVRASSADPVASGKDWQVMLKKSDGSEQKISLGKWLFGQEAGEDYKGHDPSSVGAPAHK